MTDSQPFDTRKLNHLDKTLRGLVDEQYAFCLHKCNIKGAVGLKLCKDNCVKDVLVPYRFLNHAAKSEEDNLYKKCLSEKFPNITPQDYQTCSQNLYKDRLQVISTFMGDISERLLSELH